MRLSHLAAVATLVALLGAMFVAMGSAAAHSVGECDDDEYLTADACRDNVLIDLPGDDPDAGRTVKFDPDTHTEAAEIALDPWDEFEHDSSTHGPSVTIKFDDSDGIVSASAGQLTGTVTVTGILTSTLADDEGGTDGVQRTETAEKIVANDILSLAWIRVSGELDHAASGEVPLKATTGTTALDNDDASTVSATFTVVIPAGTTPGEYTVSTYVIDGVYDAEAETPVVNDLYDYSGEVLSAGAKSGSKSFEVGDAGVGLSSATLSLGNREADKSYTVSDEAKPESGSDVADGDGINLVVSAFNSLGNKSNPGDVSRITVIAPGGNVEIGTDDGDLDKAMGTNDSASNGQDVGQMIRLKVRKADGKPGNIDVYAILTGPSGAAVTETRTLHFTGDASALELGDASGTLHNQVVSNAVAATADSPAVADSDHRDRITVPLTANDSGGNTAGVPNVRITIKDPKGGTVGTTRIARDQTDKAPGKNNQITLESMGSATNPLAAGEYTVMVTGDGNTAEGTFMVAGAPDNIVVSTETNTDEVQLGSLVTVTATVTSGDAKVSEGTLVDFASGGALKLDPVGKVEGVKTKAGVAKAKFIVSSGSGLGTVIVTSGDADGTATVTLPGAEAMADEEASVSCLHNLAGFTSWTCDVESSASEIFGLVSGRGRDRPPPVERYRLGPLLSG